MDYNYLFKDAFKYPLSDFKKFLILAIPNLLLQVVALVIAIVFMTSTDIMNNYTSSITRPEDIYSMGIVMIVYLIIYLIVHLFNSGIGIETIKKSFTSHQLPDFDISRFFVSGLKNLILAIGYILIPVFVLLLVLFLAIGMGASLADSNMAAVGAIIMVIVAVCVFVASVFVGILAFVAQGRLAETNSLSEVYDFKNIYAIAKRIGLLNIFCVQLLFFVILFVLMIVMGLISYIPIIGQFISALFMTYVLLVSSRLISLVYQHKDIPQSMPYPPQMQMPNYQSRYANDSSNQVSGGYNQVPGGYYPPQQGYPNQGGYNQPDFGNYNPQGLNQQQQGYNQPQQGYNQPQQGYNQPQQGYNQPNNPSQGHDSQNYYNPDKQNTNTGDVNQEYQEDDSIIRDKTSDSSEKNDLDFKNMDSSDDNKKI